MSGWIKLHRSLIDWAWYSDKNAVRLLTHLLVTVNREDRKWRSHIIPAGSRVISWRSLCRETGLTQQELRTAMLKLISSNEVTKVLMADHQVISLVKWDKLQGGDDDETDVKRPKPRRFKKTVKSDSTMESGNADSIPGGIETIHNDLAPELEVEPITFISESPKEDSMKKSTMGDVRPRKSRTKSGPDFIDEIIQLWQSKYQEHRGHEYIIMSRGKERSAAGKLANMNRKAFPDLDKEKAMEKLGQTFSVCLSVEQPWYWNNMSMPLMLSHFNQIKNYVTTSSNRNAIEKVTQGEVNLIIEKVFATPTDK